MFAEADVVDAVLAESEASYKALTNYRVRLMGFANFAWSTTASILIFLYVAV